MLFLFLFLRIRRTPRSTLFPYTTLFRSQQVAQGFHLGGFDEAELGKLVRILAVVGEVVVLHGDAGDRRRHAADRRDRKSTRLNSSHSSISYAVFCLKKKT